MQRIIRYILSYLSLLPRRLRDRKTVERDQQVVQSGHAGVDDATVLRRKPEGKIRILLQDLRGKFNRAQPTGRVEISQFVDARQ